MTTVTTSPAESAPTPPVHRRTSPGAWMKKNLFSNWYNSLLTIVFGAFILWALYALISYLIGVDTEIIVVNLRLYMAGRFPSEQLERLWGAIYVASATVALFSRVNVVNAQNKAAEAGLEYAEGPEY